MTLNLHTYEENNGPLTKTQMDENWRLIEDELMKLTKLTEESLNKKSKTVTILRSDSEHITAKVEDGFVYISNLKTNQICKLTLDLFNHIDIETLQIKYSESFTDTSFLQNEIIATDFNIHFKNLYNHLEEKEYIAYEA